MITKLISKGMGALLAAALLLLSGLSLSAQSSLKASGTVIDENKTPMIGVSVIEKGTMNGVITDIDGNWELDVKGGQYWNSPTSVTPPLTFLLRRT